MASLKGIQSRSGHSGPGQEIFQHGVAVLGQDGLWMELHTFDIQLSVFDAHDLAIVGPGRDLQVRRTSRALDGQGVVTVDSELRGQPRKHPFLGGGDLTGFAMHEFLCTDDLSTHGSANALMTQANPQNGELTRIVLDRSHGDPGFGR